MPTLLRVWLVIALAVTVVLVPLAFPDRDGAEPPEGMAVSAGTDQDGDDDRVVRARGSRGGPRLVDLTPTSVAEEASSTTTTTEPPTTTTTAEPEPTTTSTAVPPRPATTAPPTTTTAPPTTTTTAAPAPSSSNTQEGKASWYDHEPGICAHRTLPFGTVVTVTNTENGRSTRCTVGDRGPYVDGWIIDLNPREFEQLAPLDEGVIPVRIAW